MNKHQHCLAASKRVLHFNNGFTLLELLIAITIFSLLSTACYHLLGSVTQTQKTTSAVWKELFQAQKAYKIIQKDIEQMAMRPVRTSSGQPEYAMHGPERLGGNTLLLSFTRAGFHRLAGESASDLLRVTYVSENGSIVRYTQTTLDTVNIQQPVKQTILDQSTDISIQFLDHKNQWISSWPPASEEQKKRLMMLPKAIRMSLLHEPYGSLQWLFNGVSMPHESKVHEGNKKDDTDESEEYDDEKDNEGETQ